MPSKIKFLTGGAITVIILIVIFFIPVNEISDAEFSTSEFPPLIVVLSKYSEEFEISPISCKVIEDIVEFEFNVQNNLDEDYNLEIYLVLNNKDDQNLSRKTILIPIEAGQTVNEKHQTSFNPTMKTCVIELD